MQFLFDAIDQKLQRADNSVAVSDDFGQLTWRELRNAVFNFSACLDDNTKTVGILAPNGCHYVVAQLAAILKGKTVVPLPTFFSPSQLAAIVQDASVEQILVTVDTVAMTGSERTMPITINVSDSQRSDMLPGFEQIIYTSGSSGTPKGVRHGSRQIEAIVRALALASQATSDDRYLSILPLPMLLETNCAIFLPLFVGATVHFDRKAADAIGKGNLAGISAAFARHKPTATVLVPQVLRAWVFELKAAKTEAPSTLRFVAVGGAPVPAPILEAALAVGIPVFEGYGLSECCSVVSLNHPGHRKNGSAGQALDGITLSIDNGEIVVDGPTIMNGYLGQGTPQHPWRTGDLGSLDDEGFLHIHGRKDNLIVTAYGRNISPEWVETQLTADPRIAIAAVSGHGLPALRVLLIPTEFGQAWFATANRADVQALIADTCRGLPDYAIPAAAVIISLQDAAKAALVTANGRIVRCRITLKQGDYHDILQTTSG